MSEHLKGHNSLAEMVSTHISPLRKALIIAKEAAEESDEPDDVLYYDHELRALSDIEAACAAEAAIAASSR